MPGSATIEVELLWWAGCPSTEKARELLQQALADTGLESVRIKETEVREGDDLGRLDFHGSPTVRINGEDVVPPTPTELVGLSCRIYFKSDGRVSPLPEYQVVREALEAAKLD